jgi:hypothetical protein
MNLEGLLVRKNTSKEREKHKGTNGAIAMPPKTAAATPNTIEIPIATFRSMI